MLEVVGCITIIKSINKSIDLCIICMRCNFFQQMCAKRMSEKSQFSRRNKTLLIYSPTHGRDLELSDYRTIYLERKQVDIVYMSRESRYSRYDSRYSRYHAFTRHPWLFEEMGKYNPDYVLVEVAGNSIDREEDIQIDKKNCIEFYRMLRVHLPGTKIICLVVEPRFFHDWDTYSSDSRSINEVLRENSGYDYILDIAEQLNRWEIFQLNGKNLNNVGLRSFFCNLRRLISEIEEDKEVETISDEE